VSAGEVNARSIVDFPVPRSNVIVPAGVRSSKPNWSTNLIRSVAF